jgi:argininosuccinate lyase
VSKALWGGRFSEPVAEIAHRFSSSIHVDGRLYREDIAGSIAHTKGLIAAGILSSDEGSAIVTGLNEVCREIESGEFQFDRTMEDVHMAIEGRLIQKIGAVGGKLHTGRSRNDQVATDVRLYLRRTVLELVEQVTHVQRALLAQADSHKDTIAPGYTHLQRAQPTLLAHHLLAYVEMFGRDAERLSDALKRVDRSPLGASAFAGTSYPIDRTVAASALDFSQVLQNSMDAVSDRDHLIEVVSDCAIIMMHLSRLAEELVIWSTSEFGFVKMSDAVTTGSSIMPQKKNPDMAELTRGKVGRVYGDLMNLLTIMKSLPMAYNRDLQEDKEPLFDAIDTTRDSLAMMAYMIGETTFQKNSLTRAAESDQLIATEVADYLARKGLPFREAHEVTGRIVAHAERTHTSIRELSTEALLTFSPLFAEDVHEFLDPRRSLKEKKTAGSTNPGLVAEQVALWKSRLAEDQAITE